MGWTPPTTVIISNNELYSTSWIRRILNIKEFIELVILFFFNGFGLVMKCIEEQTLHFVISFGIFVVATGALSRKWRDLLEKQMKEPGKVVV